MGQAQALPAWYPKEATTTPLAKSSTFRQATAPITSGPNVKKENYLTGEKWGPYKKEYIKPVFGKTPIFVAPDSVDGIPLLCGCNEIPTFMKDHYPSMLNKTSLFKKHPPACYDDGTTIMNPYGNPTFDVYVRHPDFFQGLYPTVGITLFGSGRQKTKKRTIRRLRQTLRRRRA